MNAVAQQMRDLVANAGPRMLSMSEEEVARKPYQEKWSLKEVLGHLIDSAANNHQRFVRMQLRRDIGTFSYDQEQWNKAQKYQLESWANLVSLWISYNTHLAHVVEHVDSGSLDNTCDMGYENPAKLSFVMEDYVRHVRHHLDQIFGGGDANKRKVWVSRDPASEGKRER
jgi:hypothetical protein